MEQIFIRVDNENGEFYDKDIRDSTYEERFGYYVGLSHGQIVSILEEVMNLNK